MRRLLIGGLWVFFCVTFYFTLLTWQSIYQKQKQSLVHDPFQALEFQHFIDNLNEQYDPSYIRFNSVESIVSYADSVANTQKIPIQNNRYYVRIINRLLKKRFFHAVAEYTFEDNWLAYFAGKYIWYDLCATVVPNDILKSPHAFCSQQAIIFMEVLKIKGYMVRPVHLLGHYCLEVFYQDSWHYYDSNLEANFDSLTIVPSTEDLIKNSEIRYQVYENRITREQVDNVFDLTEARTGEIDKFPASRAYVFQVATKFLSKFAWLLFLGLIFIERLLYKSAKYKKAQLSDE
jgi:hypothetical protein